MLRPEDSGGTRPAGESPPRVVLAADRARGSDLLATLEASGYRVDWADTPEAGLRAIRESRPDLVVLDDHGPTTQSSWTSARLAARGVGVPMLEVVESLRDLEDLFDKKMVADDLIFRDRLANELPIRAARLIRRDEGPAGPETATGTGTGAGSPPPLDADFIGLLVHDLRTPLNVIGLSLRMIDQAIPRGDPDLEEDLRFVEENFKQIERMLAQLSDYYRLFDPELRLDDSEFSPRRLLDELLETRTVKSGSRSVAARAEVDPSCPESVALDQLRARTAIEYALANASASASASGGTIRVVLRGEPGRWITEVRLDQPAPSSVQAHGLSPRKFERLCGSAAERRGMELAIVARVSQMFGGSARLDVDGTGTAIVLDWPARRETA